MRYIQSLVTRTRQTDKIPMALMLDAINHALASSYGIEFESVLPTYLCDCNYKNFKTSSFHKQFNPCHNCLIIDLEKSVSRTFRYTNKSDVRVKDPITEKEIVFLFFADQEPKVQINSTDKIQRGFVGEDLEGRALPKELITEFKKDDDWDDFYSDDDSSWESYDYDSDYDYGTDDAYYQSEKDDNESIKGQEYQEPGNKLESESETTNEDSESNSSFDTKECDFQILQQIKSKKYILEVDQKITITNVSTIDLDKVPSKEQYGDDLKWIRSLIDFIRCGWSRVNVLRNSGDGDKELGMVAVQLRLMSEAYGNIFALKKQYEESSEESPKNCILERKEITIGMEKELMPILKKMVSLGKDKEAMLVAKNWLPIIKEFFPIEHQEGRSELIDIDVEADSQNEKHFEKRHQLLSDVLAVLGVLEFRRNQPDKAAEHVLESIRLSAQYAHLNDGQFDIFAYLSDPRITPSSSAPWLLTAQEVQPMSDLLVGKAPEYLNPKMQWLVYETVLSFNKNNMEEKENKKSVTLMKKMLKESKSLINEEPVFYGPKVIQLYCDIARYYADKEDWETMGEYVTEGTHMAVIFKNFVPLELKVELNFLAVEFAQNMELPTQGLIGKLVDLCVELYQQNQDFDSLTKLVKAFLEQINWDIDHLEGLQHLEAEYEEMYGDDYEEYDEDDEEDDEIEDDEEEEDDEEWDEDEDDEEWDEDDEDEEYDEDDEDEEEGAPFFDIFEDDDDDEDPKSKIKEIKKILDRDIPAVKQFIEEYRNNNLVDGDVDSDSVKKERELQSLEIRIDTLKAKYFTLEDTDDKDLEAFELYQDLIKRISQKLEAGHDPELYELYKEIVRASAELCFNLEKYNEVKKVYKQLLSYQKNMIAGMPQKGRSFKEANLDLAITNCWLGAYYSDLQTFDHALKHAQKAQELVDKYADMKVLEDVDTKMDVYYFLRQVAKETDRDDILMVADKELEKLDRLRTFDFDE